jgi:hypothetical protein
MWFLKLLVCIAYDVFDMTFGRLLFATPFVGEIIGCGLCCMMFGVGGVLYGLEALDPTEQIDGFVPLATIIAFRNFPRRVPNTGSMAVARR